MSEIGDSILDGQADRIILNLEDSPISLAGMRAQLDAYPIAGLKEIIAIKGGKITPLWP